MSHRRVGRKLGVVTKHRISMFRNMVTDLLRHESIKTTDTRAKELRRLAEKMITLAKQGTLHSRRQAAAFIRDKAVLTKLFDELAQKYKDRQGGYTRIIKFGFRKGDNAPVSIIELVQEEVKPKGKKKTKKPMMKEPLPPTEAAEAKSSKKEAAEELGLIEKQKETSVEEPKAEAEPVVEEGPEPEEKERPEEITAEATETEISAESAKTQVEETKETPEAKVEESTEEPEAKTPESSEASLESTEPETEEVQTSEAKAEGPELKDEGSSESSGEVEAEEEKKET